MHDSIVTFIHPLLLQWRMLYTVLCTPMRVQALQPVCVFGCVRGCAIVKEL